MVAWQIMASLGSFPSANSLQLDLSVEVSEERPPERPRRASQKQSREMSNCYTGQFHFALPPGEFSISLVDNGTVDMQYDI